MADPWWTRVALGLGGLALGLAAARHRVRRRAARSRRRGREGADRALRLLRRHGYRVLGTEVERRGTLRVDGEEREYRVRADALVRRWLRRYVAEFKGGPGAADPANRATRRQLLEYALLFRARGVLLVDADAGRVRRIDFPTLR